MGIVFTNLADALMYTLIVIGSIVAFVLVSSLVIYIKILIDELRDKQ
jgi:hypothetical protein